MSAAYESTGDGMFVPAEGSQEANAGPEVNTPATSTDVPVSIEETSGSVASSSGSSNQESSEGEKNTEEQHAEASPGIGNNTQPHAGIDTSPDSATQPNEPETAAEAAAVRTSQYVSLSANPSKDGSASTDTSHSSLLKDFLENFLTQETDAIPLDSMHIRADGQVEISQHDDAGNLFALEAGNQSVVDIHHANDEGYVEGGEGRASAASLCVIKGEQDDISVLTEAVLLELPESLSDAEDIEWVSFEEGERTDEQKTNAATRTPKSTSALFGSSDEKNNFDRGNTHRANSNSPCLDLCGINYYASSAAQWLHTQMNDCGSTFPEGLNGLLDTVGRWYQKLVNPSLRSKSSNGDAMKRLAETKKMERKTMREAKSIITNLSVDVTDPEDSFEETKNKNDVDLNAQKEEQQPTTAECIVAEEFHGETRDDTVARAPQEGGSPTDAEEREDLQDTGDQSLASPDPKTTPNAPVGILKKSSYQPKINPNTPAAGSASNGKKKAKKTPKASPTTPRRTPKSTRQYVDTSKKSFWASKSPKAVPVPNFKRQKGWKASDSEPSDYAMMI